MRKQLIAFCRKQFLQTGFITDVCQGIHLYATHDIAAIFPYSFQIW